MGYAFNLDVYHVTCIRAFQKYNVGMGGADQFEEKTDQQNWQIDIEVGETLSNEMQLSF